MSKRNPWLYLVSPRPQAAARLFCFPHAGATAVVYRLWPQGFPEDLEVCAVQLPGRGTRLKEALIANIPALVEALHDALLPHLDLPFAFFGHSMGAVLAREIARKLAQQGGPLPRHLMVSGRQAPWKERTPEPPMHQLPDDEFIDEISRRYGSIAPMVRAQAELMGLVLPYLRADIQAVETFEPCMPEPLPCPLTAYGGSDDPWVPTECLDAWHTETSEAFAVQVFPGDHFYLEPQRVPLVADIAARLAPMSPEAKAQHQLRASLQSFKTRPPIALAERNSHDD